MPVIIKKRTTLLETTPLENNSLNVMPLEGTLLTLDTSNIELELPQKVETGIPRGRAYLRSKKITQKPKKTLEQILPRVYNTPNVKKDFDDTNLDAYYDQYRCTDCKDTKKIMVYDTCESCDGDGCRKCNNTGEVKSYIPCQLCNSKK